MKYFGRYIGLSLLLHLLGVVVFHYSGISSRDSMEDLMSVSLFEKRAETVQAGGDNISPLVSLKEEHAQTGLSQFMGHQTVGAQESSLLPPAMQKSVLQKLAVTTASDSEIAPREGRERTPEEHTAPSPLRNNTAGIYYASAGASLTPSPGAQPSVQGSGSVARNVSAGISGSMVSAVPSMKGEDLHAEDNGALKQRIRDALRRNLVYPYGARKRRIEGTVLVAFRINQTGAPEHISIVKSSGHTILDTAAKETVTNASPFPVTGKTVEIPIMYQLK